MTDVRGPFVFSSDQPSSAHLDKAVSAGCKSHAIQLEATGAAFWASQARNRGLQVIGWGLCDDLTATHLLNVRPDVWMPQAESTDQFDELIATLQAARDGEWPVLPPCEPVMTSGGMETSKPNPTDAEKQAERNRRRDLLRSFGVTKVWVEVYKQDADRSGQPWLGDVNHMCRFFVSAYGFAEARPVLGLWTANDGGAGWAHNPYRVSGYDLTNHGRTFGAWRAEQMDDARYPEIAAVPAVSPAAPPTNLETRVAMTAHAATWEKSLAKPQPRSRITIGKRIVRLTGISDESWRKHAATFEALCDQAEADE